MSQAPSADEIAGIRKQLETLVGEYMKRADMEGKKLLIVAGEYHLGFDSLLNEAILLDVAHKHGINDLFIELEPGHQSLIDNFQLTPPLVMPTITSALAGREVYGMDISFMDMPGINETIKNLREKYGNLLNPEADESLANPELMKKREKVFSDVISAKDHNALAITGIFHLKSFLESKTLREKFVVLALDIDNTSGYGPQTAFISERINAVLKDPDIHAVKFKGSANEMRFWDILAAGYGQENAALLKKNLEEKKLLDSPEKLRTQLDNLNEALAKTPGDPGLMAQRALIHAEIGLFREAYRDARAAVRGNGVHQEILYYMKLCLPQSILKEVDSELNSKFNTVADPSMRYALDFEMLRHLGAVPDDAREKDPGLYAEILKGGITELIPARTSYKEIKEIYERNPGAIEAMHHYNINDALAKNLISVKQVGQLSPEQLDRLKSKPSGMELREAIEKILGPKDSPLLEKPAAQTAPESAAIVMVGM